MQRLLPLEKSGFCPSENTLAELVDGAISKADADRLDEHIADCDGCRGVLLGMVAGAARSRAARALPNATTLPADVAFGSGVPPLPLAVVESDRYVARREIARGGMGRILEAWDARHQRRVAIKILLRADASSAWRFVREAGITARLQHPSIVPLYEAGRWTDGEPFFAMKLVDGRSLHAAMREASTLEARVALLPNLVAVTEAIAYAHAHGVVHRDLKPANVLLGEYGETVVVDWGLAKEIGRGAAGGTDPESPTEPWHADRPPQLTVVGGTLGTPCYMPPEQARGEPVDARADVYAIGAMLYHLFTGAPPHVGKTASDTVALVLDGPPPPVASRAPGLPKDLAAVVEKAMARDPADRYTTAAEMAADLRRFAAGQLVSAHTYSAASLVKRWLARYRTAVGMTALLVIAVGITAGLSVRRIVREKDRASALAVEAERQRVAAVTQREAAEQLVHFMIEDVNDRLDAAGHQNLLAGLAGKVDEYYRATADGDASLSTEAKYQRATALATLALVEYESHHPDEALRLYRQSLALRERILGLEPDSEKARLAVSQSRVGIAVCEQELGQIDEAAGDLQAALTLTEGPGARAPSMPARLAAVKVMERQGYLAMTRGDFEEAARVYGRDEASLVALLREDPAQSEVESWLGWARFYRSICAERLGHREEARAAQEAAIAVRRELAAKEPENVSWQRNLAGSWQYLAQLDATDGHLESALDSLRGALDVQEALLRKEPDSGERSRDVLQTLLARTGIELALGRLDDALATARRGADLASRLLKLTPDGATAVDDSAESLRLLGAVQLQRGQLGEARAALRSGVATADRVPVEAQSFFNRWTIVRLLGALARVEAASSDFASAEAAMARARGLAEQFDQHAAGDPDAKQRLGETLDAAGDVASSQSRYDAACSHYTAAMTAFDAVPSPHPPEADLERAMAAWKLGRDLRAGHREPERARQATSDAETAVARLAARGVLGKGQLDAWRALTSKAAKESVGLHP